MYRMDHAMPKKSLIVGSGKSLPDLKQARRASQLHFFAADGHAGAHGSQALFVVYVFGNLGMV